MKKYPAYQKVQAHWLREIPCEWRTEKIRALFEERRSKVSDKDYPALSVGKMGVVPQLETAVKTDNGDNRKLIKAGDFAINSRSDRKGAGGISAFDGSASLIITVLQPKVELNGHYIHYLMRSHYFSEEFYRNGQGLVSDLWTTKYSSMRDIELPIPSMQEQQQIVRYLDWKTSQINHLIHGYERLISLLEERKTAVINEAVTKGIHKDVAMKNSGVHWLQEIPSHWNMVYSKQLFALRKDRAFPDDEQLTSSQKYGIISQKKFMEIEGRRVTVVLKGEDILKHVEKGDFVISMRSFQGGLEYSYVSGKISSAYVMLIPHHELVYDEYYKWLFKSPSYIKALQGTSDLIRDGQALRYANFAKVYLPQVPIEEQKEIAEYISKNVSKIEKTMLPIKEQIEFLRERRTRLISDVVTGALDVRDVVVPEYSLEQDMEVTEDGDEYEGERA